MFSKLLSISKHLPVAVTFKREFDGDNIPGDQVFLQNSTEVLFHYPERVSNKIAPLTNPRPSWYQFHYKEPDFFLFLI